MNYRNRQMAVVLIALAATAFSCQSDEKKASDQMQSKSAMVPPPPAGGAAVLSVTPGEAGGQIDAVIHASAVVTAIDPASRKITLKNEDGNEGTFTAPPEVKNFDQVKVGDHLTVAVHQQLAVLVSRGAATGASIASAQMTAPKGAKPGALVAQSYELVAKVTAIDTAKRTATLQFLDGETRVLPIREDVDLSKYKVGDSVVIRATEQLMMLVETP